MWSKYLCLWRSKYIIQVIDLIAVFNVLFDFHFFAFLVRLVGECETVKVEREAELAEVTKESFLGKYENMVLNSVAI